MIACGEGVRSQSRTVTTERAKPVDVGDIRAMTRRTFLGGTGMAAAATLLPTVPAAVQPGIRTATVSGAADVADGYWLGPDLWGNRLQDWVRRSGRLECVAPSGQRRTRTVTWLIRQIDSGPFTLRVRTGTLAAG